MPGSQGYDETYELLKTLKSKELLWFVTQHGPDQSNLRRIGVIDQEDCRFCGGESEPIEHLTAIYPNFRHLGIEDLNIEDNLSELERSIAEVTREIWKLGD